MDYIPTSFIFQNNSEKIVKCLRNACYKITRDHNQIQCFVTKLISLIMTTPFFKKVDSAVQASI